MGPSGRSRQNGVVTEDSSAGGAPDQESRGRPPSPTMPRDRQGWRVAPAPDGRGMPDEHKPPPPHRLRGFWIFVVVLLALNWISVLAFQTSGQPRVKVPFSPYFLNQLEAGQVKSISSKADTIQGTFKTSVKYPPNDSKATATTLFSTQVPSFWNSNQLTALLALPGRRGQRDEPEPGNVDPGRAAARVRPDAAARRVCSCCSRGAPPPAAAGSAGSATSAALRRDGSTRRRSW